MTTTQSVGSANVMQELYFQTLDKLGLLEPLGRVPFGIQQRRGGFTPAQRCLTFLAAQAQQCERLTDWTLGQRLDTRLQHWLGGRAAPHPATLSRTLAATDERTVHVLRREVLVPLTDQALGMAEAQGRWVFFDVDNKALPAEGARYEGTSTGRMSDGGYSRGYRLHLVSLGNLWPLEMEFTGANAHAVPSAMGMFKRLMRRVPGSMRGRMIVRGDSNHGSVQFVRFLQRYDVGYLLKCYSTQTAKKLWEANPDREPQRIVRADKADLLALDLGQTRLTGMTRKRLANGRERRRACHVTVPRVVVYREDPAQVNTDTTPACFALLTVLPENEFAPAALLEQAYHPRAGDIENIFCQLGQAFRITHMRSRTFYGNYTFLLLSLVAATLTELIREEARVAEAPIPAGLLETLVAARDCGLRLEETPEAGLSLIVSVTTSYAVTFKNALRRSYQHRFRFAA
jgi:hypothetical protein